LEVKSCQTITNLSGTEIDEIKVCVLVKVCLSNDSLYFLVSVRVRVIRSTSETF
jgi:hypothetical protein